MRSHFYSPLDCRNYASPLTLFFIAHFVRRCPSFIRSRAQATLTAAWVHKLPLLQKASPAELAANLIIRTLDEMPDLDNIKLSLVDFCSGAGGMSSNFNQI